MRSIIIIYARVFFAGADLAELIESLSPVWSVVFPFYLIYFFIGFGDKRIFVVGIIKIS
jgi:hypothetical protein